MTIELMKQALEALEWAEAHHGGDDCYADSITSLRQAIAEAEKQEPVSCIYKATTKKGETAHFGEYSAAKSWAGWGTVEQVPLKTLKLIQKSIQPCSTCEALARTVMLDQTSHDMRIKPKWDSKSVGEYERSRTPKKVKEQRQWVGLTDEEVREIIYETGFGLLMNVWFDGHDGNPKKVLRAIEAKLKEKNT